MNKYILTAMAVAALGFSACTDDTMDGINVDNQHPTGEVVSPKFQVTEAIMNTAFSLYSGDYAFYTASLTEQLCGSGNNQLMKAELRVSGELAASSTFNNCWGSAYSGLQNLKEMNQKAEELKQLDVLGAGQVLEALSWGILTEMHGDIPFSEALDVNNVKQPKVDPQADVYAYILSTMDKAITNLENATANNMAGQDLIYKGDPEKWLAAAHAVKARFLLNKGAIDPSAYALAETEAEKALAMGFYGMDVTEFNGVTCDNPWSAFVWSRGYTAPSMTVAKLMAANNDPRYDWYNGDAAVEPGDEEAAKISFFEDYPLYYDLGSQPVHLLSEAELYFILAECQARAGKDATKALQDGIAASVNEQAYWLDEIPVGEDFAAGFTADMQTIAEQKYIAMAVDGQVATYNDIRRWMAEGKEYIKLTNPKNLQGGGSVNRWNYLLPYGNSSVSSNPNVASVFGDGLYVYTKKAWLYSK